MSELETQLETIDEQLLGYTPAQRWLIYIGSAAGIVLMGWMFYLSDALVELSDLEEQNRVLTEQVEQTSPEAYRARISRTTAAITEEGSRTAALEKEKEILLDQMAASNGLVFDNRIYTHILQQILERSVRLGLKIDVMESEESGKTFFGKVREYKKLSITGTGSYPAVAEFLAFIEAQNALVQIESVRVQAEEEKPRFEAVILFLGVAL